MKYIKLDFIVFEGHFVQERNLCHFYQTFFFLADM